MHWSNLHCAFLYRMTWTISLVFLYLQEIPSYQEPIDHLKCILCLSLSLMRWNFMILLLIVKEICLFIADKHCVHSWWRSRGIIQSFGCVCPEEHKPNQGYVFKTHLAVYRFVVIWGKLLLLIYLFYMQCQIESRPQRKRPLRVVDDSNTGSAK